jgi:RNA polymerase sigma-70 factor (ECF subfamily)
LFRLYRQVDMAVKESDIPQLRRTSAVVEIDRSTAFAHFVDRAALDRAYRYATLILGDATEAEDATHDAALRAWHRFGELRDPTRFEAWFGRILVNACRDRQRGRRHNTLSLDDPAFPADGPWLRSAADPSEAVGRREAMAGALRTLRSEHLEVVVLRFYLDLTIDQIAERTNTRAGTVKSRLHYALRELRGTLDEGSLKEHGND